MADNNLTILAQGSVIRGNIFSEDVLVVEGGVVGNLFANKVVIKGTGRVEGDLSCRQLSIETGGKLNGQVKVTSDLPALPYEKADLKSLPNPDPPVEYELIAGQHPEDGPKIDEPTPEEQAEMKLPDNPHEQMGEGSEALEDSEQNSVSTK